MNSAVLNGANDFPQEEQDLVMLSYWRVVSKRPQYDPLGISRTEVIAPHPRAAVDHLLDAGPFGDRKAARETLQEAYTINFEKPVNSRYFYGTEAEWIAAMQTGAVPPNVSFPENAFEPVVPVQPRVAPKPARQPGVRRGVFASIENFLARQERYRRTWKLVGILLGLGVTALLVYIFWQLIVSIVGIALAGRLAMSWLRSY